MRTVPRHIGLQRVTDAEIGPHKACLLHRTPEPDYLYCSPRRRGDHFVGRIAVRADTGSTERGGLADFHKNGIPYVYLDRIEGGREWVTEAVRDGSTIWFTTHKSDKRDLYTLRRIGRLRDGTLGFVLEANGWAAN